MKRFISVFLFVFVAALLYSCSSSKEVVLKVQEHKKLSQPLAPPLDYEKIVNVDDVGYKIKLVGDGRFLYVGNLDGEIYRIDPREEEKRRIVELEQPVECAVAVDGNYIYVGTNRGYLFKIDKKSGKIIKKRQFPFPILGELYIKGDRLYFFDENDVVYCLDKENLETVWKYLHGQFNIMDIRGVSGIAFGSDGIYVGFDDGSVDKVSYKGDQIWEIQVGKGSMFVDSDTTPIVNGNVVYVSSVKGFTEAVNAKNGELLWKRSISSYSNMQLNIFGLFIADNNGNVYCLDNSNGETIWKVKLTNSGNIYSIKLVGSVLYAMTEDGKLVALDSVKGKIMDILDIDEPFSCKMTLCCNKLFVISRDGSVYSIFSKK